MLTSFTIVLLILIALLCAAIVNMQTKVVVATRKMSEQAKEVAKEREATAAILGLAQNAIGSDMNDENFLALFIEYAQRTIGARGAAVLLAQPDSSLKGSAIAGVFPPLREASVQIEQQLLAHADKHSEFFRELSFPDGVETFSSYLDKESGFAFFKGDAPEIFPKRFRSNAPISVMAPIIVKGNCFAFVMAVSGDDFDDHKLTEDDGRYLLRLNRLASLSIEGVRAFRERREYEKQVQTAKEEGMLQVSAGIIHNIGNAITVAKLTVLEMKESLPERMEEAPESFLKNELLPIIESKAAESSLDQFLRSDKLGSQIIPMCRDLLQNIVKRSGDLQKRLSSLSDKLNHISEIIELQQRFVGELGTENIVHVSQIVESAIRIFDETFNKFNVRIETHFEDSLPKVLVDSSMITQVLINLVKNAVEAMQSMSPDREKRIDIFVYAQEMDGRRYVATKVSDSGPGIEMEALNKLFQFGFSTKEKKKHSRGYGLHSCLETAKKYGGTIKVESQKGQGSSFIVYLPAGEKI